MSQIPYVMSCFMSHVMSSSAMSCHMSSVLYHLFRHTIQTRYPRYTTCSVLFDAHVMIMFLLYPVVCFMLHVSVTPCLHRALCFVVENVFHPFAFICVHACHVYHPFSAHVPVLFSCHMSFYLLCYIHVMLHALHRCVFIPQNDPHFAPLAIFDPFLAY